MVLSVACFVALIVLPIPNRGVPRYAVCRKMSIFASCNKIVFIYGFC